MHLRVADLAASRGFYDRVLEPLGIPFMLDPEHLIAFGSLALSDDGEPSAGCTSPSWRPGGRRWTPSMRPGLEAGGVDNGAPRTRRHGTYAAYVIDPDGNNIEAAHRDWGG